MKEYFYEVQLSWKEDRSGSLKSPGVTELEIISPETPVSEQKKRWTPEQLLAASLSSGFMKAFLDCSEKAQLKFVSYRSQCFIKIEKKNSQSNPVAILLQPVVTLSDEQSRQAAVYCLNEAEAAFSIGKLLRIPVDIHPQVEYLHAKRSVYRNS